MFKGTVIGQNISYSIDEKILFSEINLSLGKEKTGLVGRNGVGKSTLIKILLDQLNPTAGRVDLNGTVGYLPQEFNFCADDSIAHVLGIEAKLQAIERVLSGSYENHDVELIGSDWNIAERTDALFAQLGLDHLELSRTIGSLSGGEATRVMLARLFLQKPDFLILDEPTNNLDRESRQALYDALRLFKGGMLVISHDRQLLLFMDQIMELSTLGLQTYGGNYADYRQLKDEELEAKERALHDAQKEQQKLKRIAQRNKERHQQKEAKGRKERKTRSHSKMVYNAKKARSEKTKSKLLGTIERQLADVREKVKKVKAAVEDLQVLEVELESPRIPSSKIMLEVSNMIFAYPGEEPIVDDFKLTVMGPQRLAFVGPNGSGKSTLLKLLVGQLQPTSGTINIGVERYAYLDQKVAVLDHNETVLENFRRMNPKLSPTDGRVRLAAFLFPDESALKKVGQLSCGERLRAGLACALMSEQPPQLIILDEPTNHMDLNSIECIERALRDYKGALLVVSHDEVFLENIGIEDEIKLFCNSHYCRTMELR